MHRVSCRGIELTSEREERLMRIGFVWNTVTAMWEERFRRLYAWKIEHGHCAVPIAQGELGTWVSKQRQLRKRGKLSKEKIDALNSLEFTWSTADADWEEKFKRLHEWTTNHGHASVPFNEGELGWWVNTQRQCKRKGKLSSSRERRLRALGFVWNPSNVKPKATDKDVVVSSMTSTPVITPEKSVDHRSRTNHSVLNEAVSKCDGAVQRFEGQVVHANEPFGMAPLQQQALIGPRDIHVSNEFRESPRLRQPYMFERTSECMYPSSSKIIVPFPNWNTLPSSKATIPTAENLDVDHFQNSQDFNTETNSEPMEYAHAVGGSGQFPIPKALDLSDLDKCDGTVLDDLWNPEMDDSIRHIDPFASLLPESSFI